MKNGIMTLVALGLILIGCKEKKPAGEVPEAKGQTKPKNVVFILVDDLGWKDLACYGSSFYETPNIDKLAAQSNRFTNAYSPNPVCSPSRAALMTGKYPTRVGITDWIPGYENKNTLLQGPEDLYELPLEEVTLAEVLKEADYKTFFAGKWHLGDTGFYPEDQGFDINKGGHHKGRPPGGYYSPYKNPKLSDGPEGEYLTDRLTNESMAFLEENKDHPFLLYLSYYTVHTPIQASKKHIAKFEAKKQALKDSVALFKKEGIGQTVINQYNAAYASMVYALDENVGRLLEKMEALDIMDNTLVIFTSDNGGLTTLMANRKAPTSVRPLRAGKGWAYEGGIRIPLLIKRPGQKQGNEIDAPVISMDMFPTILSELDLPLRPDLHQDGISLSPLLDGKENVSHKSLFWDYPHYHGSGWTPGQAVRKGDWKLIYFYEDDLYELYNLKEDISEEHNVAQTRADKLEELKEALKYYNEKLEAPRPTRK
ncbi:sulfatase [Zobellia galactanivorans]|uniref:Sulfatase, family S1-16 n=1 Tax=Zobellia galactanivorans (strain DSM 12802 / CCUG 47099 / CIP 106680 / NCIMB 13871 / Dsij) TaxID=63186 RepID=G0L857_ZOBGA|nr:sulfatase [Zobellia galactanivorans]CAZ97964.1 Sulfatase, family S1-16 [Zobellia galactanivorans]